MSQQERTEQERTEQACTMQEPIVQEPIAQACTMQNRPEQNRRHLFAFAIAILAMLVLVTSAAVLSSPSLMGKYTTRVEQAFELAVKPTKPILASQGTWFRASSTQASEITDIIFTTSNYLAANTNTTSDPLFVETFNADVKDIGTIQCFVFNNASGTGKYMIVSGNYYNSSDAIYANVDSEGIFSAFTGLESISNINRVDVSNATTLKDAFKGCSALLSISGLGSWTTSSATTMEAMFYGCTGLTSLDLSSFNLTHVTSTKQMFQSCSNIATLNLTGVNFDTAAVTDMSGMFCGMSSLNSISVGAGFTTAAVTDMSQMFASTTRLATAPVGSFNTSAVTTFAEMFSASGVTSLDLSSWDTSAATSMYNMFKSCTALTSVTATQNFVVTNVTNSTDMFRDCSVIVGQYGTTYDANHIDKLYARIDTTNFPGYFRGTTLTITYDANGGTGAKAVQYVLSGVADTLTAGYGTFAKQHYFWIGWNTAADGSGTAYADQAAITITADTVLYSQWDDDEATFLQGSAFNATVKALAGATSPATSTANTNITAIVESATAPAAGATTVTLSDPASKRPITGWLSGSTLYYYTPAETVYLNSDASHMYEGFTALASIDTQRYTTSRTTNMASLFKDAQALTSTGLDLSAWNTASVTTMASMFDSCAALTGTLNLTSFSTSAVTDMSSMFNGCSRLTAINGVASFNTSSVTSMASMFKGCSSVTRLDLTGFTHTALSTCAEMFSGCTSLVTINVNTFEISGSTTITATNMFLNCVSVVGGAGHNFDSSYVNDTYARIDSSNVIGYFTGPTKKVVFHINDGITPETTRNQYILPGTTDTLMANTFTRTGYTFANAWNTLANGTGTAYAEGGSITVLAGDITQLDLYAQWTENDYNITMDPCSGTWVSDLSTSAKTVTHKFTNAYTLPTASDLVRTGYTFAGWYESSSYTGTAITSIPANVASDKTVYAKWTENTYSITYNTNGGTFSLQPATTRLYTEAVTLPVAGIVSRTGYLFEGWYETSDFSDTPQTSIAANTAANKTYYAKWTLIHYLVRFNANGGQAYKSQYITAINATYNVSFTMPSFNDAFSRSSYTFVGYDTDASTIVPDYAEGDSAVNLTSVDGATVIVYVIWAYDMSIWETGKVINAKLKSLVAANTPYTATDTTIEHFVKSATAPTASDQTVEINRSDSAGKTLAWYDSSTKTVYWYSLSKERYLSNDCSYMFYNMTALQDVDLDGVYCKNPTSYLTSYSQTSDMSHMFENCTSLVTAPTTQFASGQITTQIHDDTADLTTMQDMFKGCTSLATVDFSTFDTSNVTNMSGLFEGCTSVATLDLSDLETSAVTDMSALLKGCTGLTSVSLKTFDTSSVTNMSEMFMDCQYLPSLSLASFDTSAVTNSTDMFTHAYRLAKIQFMSTFTLANTVLPTPDPTYIYDGQGHVADGNWYIPGGSYYTVGTFPTGASGTFYALNNFKYATFLDGASFNKAVKTLAAGSSVTDTATADTTITSIEYSLTAPSGSYITVSATAPAGDTTGYYATDIKAWLDNGTLYYYSDADLIFMNPDASYMFQALTKCTSIDFANMDSRHTTNMAYLFAGMTGITNLSTSLLDASNVTNMSYMFSDCKSLTALDASGFDTSNVTDLSHIFYGDSALTTSNISNWDTSKVTTLEHAFHGCSALITLDVSNWDTSSLTSLFWTFQGCSRLTTLDVSNWDTSSLTSLCATFYNCSALTTLDVSNWDTSNVTTLYWAFYRCTSLTTLDVSNWDTSNVTTLYGAFQQNRKLTTLDVSNWDTSNVTSLLEAFDGCINITTLDVSKWDTSKVVNMNDAFNGCQSLVTLDVSSWDTSKATSMSRMFSGCSNLTTIFASGKFVTSAVSSSSNMFSNCTSLVGGVGTVYTSSYIDKTYARIDTNGSPGYFTATSAEFMDGPSFNAAIKTLVAGSAKTTNDTDTTVTSIVRSTTPASAGTTTTRISSTTNTGLNREIIAWINGSTLYWYTTATIASMPTDISEMFKNFASLQTIDLGWGTSDVSMPAYTDIAEMFKGCSSLIAVNSSMFDTSQVTDFSSVFEGCSSLVDLQIDFIDTTNATTMDRMFYDCSSLPRLNMAGWNVANAISATDMFTNALLHEVDVTSGMTGVVQAELFNSKPAWYSPLDLTRQTNKELTPSGTTMQATVATQMNRGAFYDHASITYATLVNFYSKASTLAGKLANIKYVARSMTAAPAGTTTADLSNNGTITGWFDDGTLYYYTTADQIRFTGDNFVRNFTSVIRVDISGWSTSTVTRLSSTFDNCYALASLDVSGWDTSNATSFSSTFLECNALTSLDVSHWDTSKVTSIYWTFYRCRSLKTLDVSNWDTSNVTNMPTAFRDCTALTTLDISNWDTSKVVDFSSTFYGCTALTSLDVSSWDTSKVTNLSHTFRSCTALISLDVSSWNTSKVTSISNAFYGCSSLATLDVSNWDTSKVTTLEHAFNGCNALTSLDVSNWDTSNVTALNYAFMCCYALTSLDVSNWDTSNLTTFTYAFYSCRSLVTLDLSSWDTSKSKQMDAAFNGCSKLTTIFASANFVTTAVTSSTEMFTGCSKLVGGAGTSYSASHRDATYARLDDPTHGKPGYFSEVVTYNVTYWDYAYTSQTQSYFQTDYQTGGIYEDQVVYTRRNTDTIILPTESMLVVPAGKKLDGWLIRGDQGWESTPIYTIAAGTPGDMELTPNWVDL